MIAPGVVELVAHKHNNVLNHFCLFPFCYAQPEEFSDMWHVWNRSILFINNVFVPLGSQYVHSCLQQSALAACTLGLRLHTTAIRDLKWIICLVSSLRCILHWIFWNGLWINSSKGTVNIICERKIVPVSGHYNISVMPYMF